MYEVTPTHTFMGGLDHNCDLLESLTTVCTSKGIKLARVEAIGAVKKAALGYYDQDKKEYSYFVIDRHLEIISLVGNISLKDGKPFVHAHITLADDQGNSYGGHLIPGTIIFACEVIIQAFAGPEFKRELEPITGLPLWAKINS
ncbi:MAG: DNA-binding protein [Magnetococcales bacterium]|nr:DNA-binding protein [Magnetococcales bacterium]